MDPTGHAAAQLTTIRTLLERATIYRAISVPGAAVGGVLALAAAWLSRGMEPRAWLGTWLAVLAMASAFNFFQLAREARRDQRVFFTNGLRLALRGFLPPLLAGSVLGLGIGDQGDVAVTAMLWILFYGLGLLAVREFAPLSLARLGIVFFAVGLACFVVLIFDLAPSFAVIPPAPMLGSTLMGVTFGLFHLGYAAAVVFTRRP